MHTHHSKQSVSFFFMIFF